MPSLREDLEERYAEDIAAILDLPPERADTELAAMWQAVLQNRDPIEILGNAVLWCSQRVLAGAVAECVWLLVGHAGKRARDHVAVLALVERYSRGDAPIEAVWDAKEAAKGSIDDPVGEAVLRACGAAGDNEAGFDDEALNAAGRGVMAVIEIGGEANRDPIVAIFRRRIPVPTVALFHAAHADRYAD